MNDSIWLASDSNVIRQSELYKQGILLPDRTVPVGERSFAVRNDDYFVAGMAVMFFLLAAILYRSRNVLWHRLKNFFTTKRTYTDDDTEGNSDEAIHVFLLISISAISLSCMFLDDRIALSSFLPVTGIPYWLFGAGFVMCMAFIYFKAWLYLLVNWVFFDRDSSQRWIVGYLLLTALTAFLFYPLALLDVFAHIRHEIVIGGAILVGVLYEFMLFYKLIANFRVKKYGYMLIFLYFCTVELLPTLVFGHLTVWLSDNYLVKNILY
jgi:hypothetical protein